MDVNELRSAMFGAICGDIAGSEYEWENIKYKLKPHELITKYSRFTDDTVMTCAVADGLSRGLNKLPLGWIDLPESERILCKDVQDSLITYANKYPRAGYGGSFYRWFQSKNPQPYNSWGNGSAMRASYAGWAARSLEEAEKLGEISAKVTHNHPEGIKGAKVVAGCIYLLKSCGTKIEVMSYASQYYDLNFTLDEIRADYTFDVSCQGSVPQAIKAFLEGESFTDVIANAISIGGDSDTIAAIAGSLAEVIYPIPAELLERAINCLDEYLLETILRAVKYLERWYNEMDDMEEDVTMQNFDNLMEIQTESEDIFEGRILHLFRDTVELPNGNYSTREVIRHNGAVGVVPLFDDGTVIVERQFRYPFNKVITEIPAGKLDGKSEDKLDAAKRELKEETGYTAEEWISLGDYYPAAAYCDEVVTLFLAKGLKAGEQKLDADEFLNVERVPLEELVEQVMQGEIPDGKTQTAIMKTWYLMK